MRIIPDHSVRRAAMAKKEKIKNIPLNTCNFILYAFSTLYVHDHCSDDGKVKSFKMQF